jgi:hypothetical protein
VTWQNRVENIVRGVGEVSLKLRKKISIFTKPLPHSDYTGRMFSAFLQ